jgi:hypothetical protein
MSVPVRSLTERIQSAREYTFGTISQASRDFTETTGISYMVPIIGTIILMIVIASIVIASIYYNTKRPARTLLGPINLFSPSSPTIMDRPTTKATMANSYTLAMYFRMDSVPDMRARDTPILTWPNVWNLNYKPAQEQLSWVFSQVPNAGRATGPDTVNVDGIPLQRWNQVVISFEGRTVDIYCNGALMSSTTLFNVPPIPNASITLLPSNIVGEIAYIQVWSRRLTTSEVASNYVETSDSQGRPYLGPDFFKAFKIPNIFCPNGQCEGVIAQACEGLNWEFPYR